MPFIKVPRLFLLAISATNLINELSALSLTGQLPPVELLDVSIVTERQFAFQFEFVHAISLSLTNCAILPSFPIP